VKIARGGREKFNSRWIVASSSDIDMTPGSFEISDMIAKKARVGACACNKKMEEKNNSLSFRTFVIGTILLLMTSWCYELGRFPFNQDNGAILDTSRRVLDGERLYMDIPEVNPPLIFILGRGVVLLSRMTGFHEILVWRLCFLLATTLVILFTGQLIEKNGWKFEHGRCQGFLWSIIALFFCYPGNHFSQREHLAAVFLLPYVLVCSGRACGKPVDKKAALLSGFLAGLAFSFKPFFLLVFCLIEIYMRGTCRETGQPWIRLENTVATAFFGGYLLWVILGTPYLSYLRFIEPYYASYNMAFFQLLFNFNHFPFVLATLLHGIFEPPKDEAPLRQMLFLTALGFTLSFVVQLKGFGYHGLPARIFSWTLVSLIVLGLASAGKRKEFAIRAVAYQFSANFCIFPVMYILFISGLNLFCSGGGDTQALINQIRELGGGKKAHLLTFSCWSAFPAFNYCGIQTTQRGSALILAKLYHGIDPFDGPFPYKNGSETWELLQSYIDITVEDIATRKPDYIFSDDRLDRQAIGISRFNFIEFLMLDDRFKLLFQTNYQFLKEAGAFKVFKRRTG
jgi:hypothetical protein